MALPWLALNSVASFLPFFVSGLLLLLLRRVNQRKSNNHHQLPPGPPPLPVIGNLHQLGPLPHQSLWRLSRVYGPVLLVHLGRVPTVVLSSAKAAREVLKTHDLDTCSRPRLIGTGRLSYNYIDIAFAPYGDYWREMRKLCIVELFSAKRVDGSRFVREEEVEALLEQIGESAASGSAVDLSKSLMGLSAAIVSRVAFGRSFRGLGAAEGNMLVHIVHEALAMLGSFSASDFFPYFGWIIDRFSGLHKRLEKNFHELDRFYQQIINDHLQDHKEERDEGDIVDLLLEMEKNRTQLGENNIFTRDHTKAILMDIFLAGVDTGSIIMEWTMTELARNPRVMKKLQDEIRSCVGNKKAVTEDDLDQLQYLKLVLKESMRLHPPSVLLIPRETMRHFKLFGYDIPLGTRIQVNAWGIGRDPELWEDPEKFYPERFENSPIDYKGQHFELLIFGSGRRGCPGIYMGMVTVELAIANLLHRFDWRLPDGMTREDMNMEEGAGLTVFKKVPLLLVPVEPCE
ncbi:hypothetical protein MLD38_011839 [Melastoma candidum]|uniref:Uncharacterized protein n=1 Tax=Melastoma candidum TaxID=119954 RepID=A0ACB9R4E3_9MYRT|nr:hypothetical protein MLD38_011839 [Melastoma candidum]